jgi:hypothetical protein
MLCPLEGLGLCDQCFVIDFERLFNLPKSCDTPQTGGDYLSSDRYKLLEPGRHRREQ